MSEHPPVLVAPHAGTLGAIAGAFPLLGLALLHHRNFRGEALRFSTMPYLVELYRDYATLDGADAVKAVQTGWTELVVQLAFERAGWAGRNVAYVLPKGRARDTFVQTRVDPHFARVPAYRERYGGTAPQGSGPGAPGDGPTNLHIKQFGPGTMRFLGSNVADEFVEWSADVLIVDEYDHCDESNLDLARDRLRASPHPQVFRLGNPTSPGKGIARLFDDGDGRRWHHRCDRCGERQPLAWDENVVERDPRGRWVARDRERANDPALGDIRPVCRRCRQPFDRQATGGCWVAERPATPHRSYTMSRLDVLDQSLRALVAEWIVACRSPSSMVTFRRSNLGEACDAEGYRLSSGMVERRATGPAMDASAPVAGLTVVAGIDVGAVLHVVIDAVERVVDGEGDARTERRVRRMLYATEVGSFDALVDLLHRFGVKLAVVDAAPETRKAQELRDLARREGGWACWLCRFHQGDKVGSEAYAMRLEHVARVVTVDRTQLLDATFDDVSAEPPQRVFPRDVVAIPEFTRQVAAPVRQLSERGDRYVWDEGTAPDHYRLADAYARVAADVLARGGWYMVVDTSDGGLGGDDDQDGNEAY